MFDRLSRSWNLTQESYRVLMMDKELLLFPVLSAVLTLVLLASFFVPVALMVDWSNLDGERLESSGLLGAVVIFAFYFVVSLALVFCNAAMLHCAGIRFRGGDPTVMDGIRFGFSRFGSIVAWAALSATVGSLLSMIEERMGFVGQLLRRALGAAWAVVSFFAVPVWVFEDVGPFEAIKRSKAILSKTWGESLAAYIGFGAVQGLLAFVGIIGTLLAVVGGLALEAPALAIGGGVLGLLYFLALAVVLSSLVQVYRAAIYVYATTGEVPKGYSEDLIRNAFRNS